MRASLAQATAFLSSLASATVIPSPGFHSSSNDITTVAGTTGTFCPMYPIGLSNSYLPIQVLIAFLSTSVLLVRVVSLVLMMDWWVE